MPWDRALLASTRKPGRDNEDRFGSSNEGDCLVNEDRFGSSIAKPKTARRPKRGMDFTRFTGLYPVSREREELVRPIKGNGRVSRDRLRFAYTKFPEAGLYYGGYARGIEARFAYYA